MEPVDHAVAYRAVESRDRRFDGIFYTAVRTTGIYCRPSCPARTPRRSNVAFFRTAAAAQAAGYRACKRCLPDATPGSPAWDVRADAAGRAMRLISDGTVEREGVPGLARRLGYTPRHLTRLLTAELGAGPLALARARRAQQARTLVESTSWRFADVAFAAGFASVRQFNDTIREVYDATPSQLRGRRRRASSPGVDSEVRLDVRLPVRTPFDAAALLRFLQTHATPGVEAVHGDTYVRSVRLPHGPGTVALDLTMPTADPGGVHAVPCRLAVSDLRDVAAATERCRRLLDADCDPVAVDDALRHDALFGAGLERHAGLRVPGHVDGDELALCTVLGQQVSVRAGNRLAGHVCDLLAEPLPASLRADGVDRLFPAVGAVAALDPGELPMPRARAAALIDLAAAVVGGDLFLDRSAPRSETRARLLQLRGIGPWTADYVLMRASGDPDVFLPTDGAARRALGWWGVTDVELRSERWRPWRSYALLHLWTGLDDVGSTQTAAPAVA